MGISVPLLVLGAAVLLYLYVEVTTRFEGRLWKLPSRVYSDRLVLRVGSAVPPGALVDRLDRSGYVEDDPTRPGVYSKRGETLEVYLRAFEAPWGRLEPRRLRMRLRGGKVVSIEGPGGRRMTTAVFEPELLASLFGSQQEEREVVPLVEIPRGMVLAVLAAEDSRFFSHHGVDPRAVARAALANLRHRRVVQGGSTITQQTVKNLYLGQERTWWRKIREVLMSSILDGLYTKERILEVYLNEVYLGQRGPVAICGIQAASRFYFGRDLGDLSQGEWALLAGLIRNPGGYNPFRERERAIERRNYVLEAMQRQGYIGSEEAERATAEEIHLVRGSTGSPRAPYVIDFVRSQLGDLYTPRTLSEYGLRIFTSVDTFLQESAERALEVGLERLDREAPLVRRQKEERVLQGLVLVTRPDTGEVLAMVGGRDYQRTQFNRAVQAVRQPGSCFKPFVYLAGFEAAVQGEGDGLIPTTMLEDEPLELESGGESWRPSNYDGRFRGPVSVRRSLEESLNVPTVRAAIRLGFRQVAQVAERCGFERRFRSLPSLALGAQEVTPLELATAYGTLANHGRRASPLIIKEVTDQNGLPLERRRVELSRAVTPQAAFLVTDILRGVMSRGTGASAAALGFRGLAAGKTGTTDETRDAWFVGYNPDVLALVWVGYDDNSRTGLTGASGALPIWVDFMDRAGYGRSRIPFQEPRGMVRRVIDPGSGQLAARGCPVRELEFFAAGTEPHGNCRLHRPGFFRRLRGRRHRDTI